MQTFQEHTLRLKRNRYIKIIMKWLLEWIKDNIWAKTIMTIYILIIGFGYFFFAISMTIEIAVDDSSSNFWIILVWFSYFTFLSFPAYYSWSFIKIFFKSMTIYNKMTIMLICFIIPVLYLLTSLLDLWIIKSRVSKMKEKAMERNKKIKGFFKRR